MNESKTVGDRIRARRMDLAWTQDALAAKADISKGFLSDLENGKREVGAANLLKIAQALSVTLDYLMKGDGGKHEAPGADLKIPAKLAELAEQEHLSFAQTVTLLNMQSQIVAHRSSFKPQDPEHVDWRKFYSAVKEYLK